MRKLQDEVLTSVSLARPVASLGDNIYLSTRADTAKGHTGKPLHRSQKEKEQSQVKMNSVGQQALDETLEQR